ncbi:MAG: hypothetical protein C3F11_02325 [Methylocystaceae bacterium]|nr:MAG: hypothetical protein C3F11_02325 [Methylocystaceae bacterium]
MRPVLGSARGAVLSFALAAAPSSAMAKEIHLDCRRPDRSVAVDVDTSRLFVQLMWGQGVAEEYQNGDSYLSGPSASGQTHRVIYAVSVENDAVSFGQDYLCVAGGADGKCKERHIRNTLDTAAGVLRYDDDGIVTTLECRPAPPSRRF